MAIPSLTLRNTKGSALTFTEVDNNFQNLANATVNVTAGGTTSNIALNSAVSIANTATIGASISDSTISLTALSSIIPITAGGSTNSTASSITFANTATIGASLSGSTVSLTPITTGTAGSYVNVTTDVYGRVTAGSNQLSANLDANGQYVSNAYLNNYREKVANVGPLTGSLSINANTAPVQTGAVTGSITLNSANITNLQAGKSITLLLYQTGNYTLTSDMKFVQGTKTISATAGNVDALTVFYDGTSYIASLAKYW